LTRILYIEDRLEIGLRFPFFLQVSIIASSALRLSTISILDDKAA